MQGAVVFGLPAQEVRSSNCLAGYHGVLLLVFHRDIRLMRPLFSTQIVVTGLGPSTVQKSRTWQVRVSSCDVDSAPPLKLATFIH